MTRTLRALTTLCLVALTLPRAARADEGMWTFDDFPAALTDARYQWKPTPEWLDHVRLSSARLARGCSASFVSAQGLVLTNHHCVRECVEKLSTAKDDLITRGFLARTPADERRCPGMELNQLTAITDVTREVQQATAGLADQRFVEARNAEISRLEKACAPTPDLRCDVVTLYSGGRYALYRYRRLPDVRLAFAPELAIAHFGGDPDNFNFPRYAFDVALLRIHDDAGPIATPEFLRLSKTGAQDGQLVFTSGNPGSTRRLLTVAELAYLRDVELPRQLLRVAEFRGLLTAFSERGKEEARVAKTDLYGYENTFKGLTGRQQALAVPQLFADKVAAEAKLRAAIDADPARKARYGAVFDTIERTLARQVDLSLELRVKEGHRGYFSTSLQQAVQLVRWSIEAPKPNGERLPEYADARLPALQAQLLAPQPIYPDLEIEKLGFGLTKAREDLGTDDPFIQALLGQRSPRAVAEALVRQTKLREVSVRERLWKGGPAAVLASTDPLIAFARIVEAAGRDVRKTYERDVEGVLKRSGELLGRARLEIQGTAGAPDATFSPRLSFGQVKGFEHRGRAVGPFSELGGLFARATGAEPYALPGSWTRAASKLDPKTPMNLATTNDIIGGNSGSPLIDARGELVGLIFDGNIYSLGGDYRYDGEKNRAVAVDVRAIVAGLEQVYGARALAAELQGGR